MVDNAIISDLKLHCRTAAPPHALRNRERSSALCVKLGEPIYKIMLAPAPDPETRAQVAEEEKRDFELTTTYKGRPVRVEHNGVAVNGTVQVVKYDMVYILWSDGSQSSLKEAIAAALKAAKAREQQAQTVDAPQPLTLTPPSTPRRAKPSSPRGVDELRPPAAPRKSRAPPWPDGDGGATGGDRAPARHYHSPGPFEPGGADTLGQGIGVGGDGATGLAPVPPGRPPGQGRCRLSYDDDDPPGHQQDAPLQAKALLEDRAGAEGRLQASGGAPAPHPFERRKSGADARAKARADAPEIKISSCRPESRCTTVFVALALAAALAGAEPRKVVVELLGDIGAQLRPQQQAAGRRRPPALRGARRRFQWREPRDRPPPDREAQ